MAYDDPKSNENIKHIRTGLSQEVAKGTYAHDCHFNMTLYDACFTFFVREPLDLKGETLNVTSRVYMPIHKAKEIAELVLLNIKKTENNLRGNK
jgi:hypothetical protein